MRSVPRRCATNQSNIVTRTSMALPKERAREGARCSEVCAVRHVGDPILPILPILDADQDWKDWTELGGCRTHFRSTSTACGNKNRQFLYGLDSIPTQFSLWKYPLNERDIKDSLKEKREEEKELKHEVSGKLPKSNLIQPGSDLSQRPSQQPAGPGAGQDCVSE